MLSGESAVTAWTARTRESTCDCFGFGVFLGDSIAGSSCETMDLTGDSMLSFGTYDDLERLKADLARAGDRSHEARDGEKASVTASLGTTVSTNVRSGAAGTEAGRRSAPARFRFKKLSNAEPSARLFSESFSSCLLNCRGLPTGFLDCNLGMLAPSCGNFTAVANFF